MIIFSAIVYLLSDFSNHHILFSVHPILKYLAWILLFSGIIILTLALYSYNILDFTGINQLFGREEIHGKLITSGLNSIVRHPIYFAIILLIIGLSILYPTDLILLTSLFYISGAIVLRGDIVPKPINNLIFLLVGASLASFIGTTGASMLLIRPLLKSKSVVGVTESKAIHHEHLTHPKKSR
jgi:protein-S-isoprenylcysteine O-methyltransferase Ste14